MAPESGARLVRREVRRLRLGGCGGGAAARGPPWRRARRGGRTRSTPPASSRRAGWRRAGRCRRTPRPRTGRAATTCRRGPPRRRPSCSGRPARPGRARARGSMPTSASAAAMLGKRPRSSARMSRSTEGAPVASSSRLDRERDLVARRQLVDEALAGGVQELRALAAHGLGDEEAVARAVAAQRRGMELHELEVGEPRAGGLGERQSRADRAARVGRARPERGHPAGGEDDGACKQRPGLAVARARDEADAAPLVSEQGRGDQRLEHRDAARRSRRSPTGRA